MSIAKTQGQGEDRREERRCADETIYAAVAKPYPSIEELTDLTPWTVQAIRSMIKRRIFVEGLHYFRIGRRLVFKWSAIVDFIEGQDNPPSIPMLRGGSVRESEEA